MHPARNEIDSNEVAQLGDEELLTSLRHLLGQERRLSARLLLHLAEVDARGLYREQAYGSMFDYCVHALHLSEAEAFLRIRAARLGRQFPRVMHMMASGELHLSAIKLLARVLTEDNCDELLALARCKSKSELELLLAQRFEKPDVPTLIRKLPQIRLAPEPVAAPAQPLFGICTESEAPLAPVVERQAQPAEPSQPSRCEFEPRALARPAVSPLGPARYKVQLTASQQFHDKLRQAQDLMRHQVPDGDIGQVLERALDLLITERMKQRFGVTSKPRRRASRLPKPGSRHIPNDVRREVVARDGVRCSYVSTEGKRCEQRGLVQLHHEQPYGRGGPATVPNIHVLCQAHNQLLAERDYGRAFIKRRIERARSDRSTPRPERAQNRSALRNDPPPEGAHAIIRPDVD